MYIKTLSLIKRKTFFLMQTLLSIILSSYILYEHRVEASDIVEHFPLAFIAARGNVRP